MEPISGAIGAGVGLIGSIIGQILSAPDRAAAAEAMRQASQAYNIPLPALQQMVAETQGSSAMEGVHADPNLVGAQNDSLGALQGISDAGGMTLEDKVNNDQLQRQAAQKAQAQRQSITNVLSRSGQAPGGVSAALQLGAARDQQEAGALAAQKTAADAQKRSIQAVLARGTQAGQMRNQAFGEGSAKAEAADRIAQYNAQAKERSQRYNLGLPQQQFNNQMSRAAGQAAVQRQYADSLNANASRTAGTAADFGAGAGAAGAGAYQALSKPKASSPYDSLYPTQKIDEYGNPI